MAALGFPQMPNADLLLIAQLTVRYVIECVSWIPPQRAGSS
jgi:hypothetical protein